MTVLQHLHSAARPPGQGNAVDPFAPVMDPQPYLDHFADDPEELARFVAQQQESDQGGTWLYQLRDGDFSLLLGDSAGPIFDQPAIVDALGRFPGCVDVMANAILGFDGPVSGLQDPVSYVDAVKPQVFLPDHADAWAPVISAGQAQYVDELTGLLAALTSPPEIDFLLDPADYLVQRAYRVADPRWTSAVPGSLCARATVAPEVVAAPGGSNPAGTPASTSSGGTLAATGARDTLPALVAVAAGLAGLALRRRRRAVPG